MEDLLKRLSRIEKRFFPRYRDEYRRLVAEGQRPRTLFIGCSDSRIVPYVLTGTGPGDLFVVRNVGKLVPPYDATPGDHSTAAAVEFAVDKLEVRDIVICGHSHCARSSIKNQVHLTAQLFSDMLRSRRTQITKGVGARRSNGTP